jgi:periplasmic protein TonB
MVLVSVERRWIWYGLVALIIHGIVLTLPVAQKASETAVKRPIDVIVMRQERPQPVEPPQPPPKRLVVRRFAPMVPRQAQPPQQPPKAVARKEETPAGGAGNVLDEQIVPHAVPGPVGVEGVGVAGVNTGGGRVGLGSGGTGAGNGTGTGNASGTGPVDAGFGDADGPQIEYLEKPEYPFAAKRLHKEGKVALRLFIDEKGKLEKVEVVESTDPMFASSAVEAMKRSRFRPARRKDVPCPCRAPYIIRFGF